MEEWKDIKGYEGLYQVSSEGRVKSLPREIISANKSGTVVKKLKERILKENLTNGGYCRVLLYADANREHKLIHKLVAEAFIPNPNGYNEVDHINTIRTDNRSCNLRWVSHKENCNNPISIEHYKNMILVKGMLGKHHTEEAKKKISEAQRMRMTEEVKNKISERLKGRIPNAKPPKKVYQYTLDGKLEKIWESTAECGRNGLNQGNVCRCCNGKLKMYKNKIFSYFFM